MNIRSICCRCERPVQSALDLQRDPFQEKAYIHVQKNIQLPDPNNKDNVIRSMQSERVLQEPALICIGCLSDLTEIPTASPIFVGGSKE